MAEINEIKDQVLEEVSGGVRPIQSNIPVELYGPIWGTCYKETGPFYTVSGRFTAELLNGGSAPYRLSRGGQYVGFTEAQYLRFL